MRLKKTLQTCEPERPAQDVPEPIEIHLKEEAVTDTLLSMPKHGAVLFAKDLPRVARFYRQVLEMTETVSEKRLIVLESATFQLVIHGLPKKVADSLDIISPPVRRIDLPTKLVFPVKSLAQARADAAALGGGIDPSSAEFTARGFTACDGFDPEGNVVQFRELAR